MLSPACRALLLLAIFDLTLICVFLFVVFSSSVRFDIVSRFESAFVTEGEAVLYMRNGEGHPAVVMKVNAEKRRKGF